MWILVALIYLTHLRSTQAQLPNTESLRNVTHCDFTTTLDLTCGTNEVIAIHSIQHAYNVRCETTCCNTYTSTDCFENADITNFRRTCSGKTSCSMKLTQENIAFCAFGVKLVSYVFLQYYCIPNDRTSSICASSRTITSNGEPLYITNENYPGVTTGSASCSCSLEAYSCSSSINVYIIDADLYYDTSNCEQNLVFKDGTDGALKTIGCDSYYKTNNIAVSTISSHYSKIDFINNSTADQEGYFFIGLEASEPGVSLSLSCTPAPETWCVDCGALQNIPDGKIELSNGNDTSYDATADVSCNNGFETNTPTISCLENGTWPDAVCTAKAACTANQWRCTNGDCISNSSRCDNFPDCIDDSDEKNCTVSPVCPEGQESCLQPNGTAVCAAGCDCGPVQVIENGDASSSVNTTIGSVAVVTCNEGYVPSTPSVTCQASGLWETASCTGVDCGEVSSLTFGNIKLTDSSNKTFGAYARVVCDSGYDANVSSVTCQSSGVWQSASCIIKDCGSVPTVQFGNVTSNNPNTTTFGSTASVRCNNGYQSSKTTITCQATGVWETPKCEVTTTPKDGGVEEPKSSINIALIIVIAVLGAFLLVQCIAVSYFQCRIHAIRRKASGENAELPKRVLMVFAGSVPVLGLIPIYFSWKVFYQDVYKVTHGHHTDTKSANERFSNPAYEHSSTTNNQHGKEVHQGAITHTSIQLEETKEETGSNGLATNNPDHQGSSVSDPTHAQTSTTNNHNKDEVNEGSYTHDNLKLKESNKETGSNGLAINTPDHQGSSFSNPTYGQSRQEDAPGCEKVL